MRRRLNTFSCKYVRQFSFVRFVFYLNPHYASGVAFLNYVCASNRQAVQSDSACDNNNIFINVCYAHRWFSSKLISMICPSATRKSSHTTHSKKKLHQPKHPAGDAFAKIFWIWNFFVLYFTCLIVCPKIQFTKFCNQKQTKNKIQTLPIYKQIPNTINTNIRNPVQRQIWDQTSYAMLVSSHGRYVVACRRFGVRFHYSPMVHIV